jgi:protein transport protein SEC24
VHADSTFAVELTHGGRLDARENAHIQCALLYTTVGGQRRVRIITLAMTIADLAGNVFKYADMDATVAYFAKDGELTNDLREFALILDVYCDS